MLNWNRPKSAIEIITANELLPYRHVVPFIDIVPTFILFIKRLHDQVATAKPKHLLFLSREGKILKQLFDIYAEVNNSNIDVKTHYFQVSRRSTWLLSLPSCERDVFAEYFKQYFQSSLNDFVKSLTLDKYSAHFMQELSINQEEFRWVYDNLFEQRTFSNLLELPIFQDKFYHEQNLRRQNFAKYLESALGEATPQQLYVADVGWKGSIQDNIFRYLKQIDQNSRVKGYYLGLSFPGFVHAQNQKQSLVFSCLGARKTTGFELFNECKALFEIYLPAGHGAALAYELNEETKSINVIYDDYPDAQMIEQYILPFTYHFIELFENLLKKFKNYKITESDLYQLAYRNHKRVVFNPLKFECEWMDKVYHSENFGVFQMSLLSKSIIMEYTKNH